MLAFTRLPLAAWAHDLLTAVGWVGVVLITTFTLRATKLAKLVTHHYFSPPEHGDKLGLQAVIGRDLQRLLNIWIEPKLAQPDSLPKVPSWYAAAFFALMAAILGSIFTLIFSDTVRHVIFDFLAQFWSPLVTGLAAGLIAGLSIYLYRPKATAATAATGAKKKESSFRKISVRLGMFVLGPVFGLLPWTVVCFFVGPHVPAGSVSLLTAAAAATVLVLIGYLARPDLAAPEEDDLHPIDFRWFQPGCWALSFVVVITLASLGGMAYEIDDAHENAAKKYAQQRWQAQQENELRQKDQRWLALLPASLLPERLLHLVSAPATVSALEPPPGSPLFTYIVIGIIGGFVLVFPFVVARQPRRHPRLFLVVDDLDRCEPEQMLAVIQSLRLFLDDPRMCRRLQMAMLMDRRFLEIAHARDAEKSGTTPKSAYERRRYQRMQREKLFLCEFEMPPLTVPEVDDLLATLLAEPEQAVAPRGGQAAQSAEAQSAAQAAVDVIAHDLFGAQAILDAAIARAERKSLRHSKLLESADFNPPADADPKTVISALEAATKAYNEALAEDRADLDAGEPAISASMAKAKAWIAAIDSEPPAPASFVPPNADVVLAPEEQHQLRKVISRLPAGRLTPRTIAMIKVRFQFIRLLLRSRGLYEPNVGNVLPGVAARLVQSHLPEGLRRAIKLDPEIQAIVEHVTCDQENADTAGKPRSSGESPLRTKSRLRSGG